MKFKSFVMLKLFHDSVTPENEFSLNVLGVRLERLVAFNHRSVHVTDVGRIVYAR